MKSLTLIRHASAVHDSLISDFDRPLKARGIEKISFNTRILNSRGYSPDLIISSPALRARQSAEVCAAEIGTGYETENIVYVNSLYLPTPGDIVDCLRTAEDKYMDLFVFSHNNGISWAAQELSGDRSIIMPTGSIVRIELNIESWSKVVFGCGRIIDFIP